MTNRSTAATARATRRPLRRNRSDSAGRAAGRRANRTPAWERTRWAAAEWILGPEKTPSAYAREHIDPRGNPR